MPVLKYDFAQKYKAYPESIILELITPDGEQMDSAKYSGMAVTSENEISFMLDMKDIPEFVTLRAFDIYEKGRWSDTVTLRLDEAIHAQDP